MILAGGLGTRLRSAFAAGPKSLAPVGTKPFLDYLLIWLGSSGISDVILCVGYKGWEIQEHVGTGKSWGLRVRYSIEKELLGTGGALKQAEELISCDSVFVVNGDTYLDVNLREMLEIHRLRQALVTVAVACVGDMGRYGSLRLDGGSRITAFHEKRIRGESGGGDAPTRWINGGVYVLALEFLKMIPPARAISLEKEVLPDLVLSKRVFGFMTDGYFLDIGIPDDYNRAQTELPKRFCDSYPH